MSTTSRYFLRGILPLGLIIVAVFSGFLLVLDNQNRLHDTEQHFDQQMQNAINGKELGQQIVNKVGDFSSNFYKMFISVDSATQQAFLTKIDTLTEEILAIADVLSHGGSISLSPPNGIDPAAVSTYIRYQPDSETQYVTNFVTLERLLQDLRQQAHDTLQMTKGRNNALVNGQTEGLRQTGLKLRIFEAQVSNKLGKVKTQAELIVSLATSQLNTLTASVQQIRNASQRRDIQSTVIVCVIICGFIFLVFRQIRSSQKRLVKTITQLEMTQRDLSESHSEILALNQSLEEQVDKRTAELKISEQQWSDAFDAIKSPIFIHDRKGRIIKANQAYLEAAGVTIDNAVGVNYWSLFPRRNMPMPGCLCSPLQQQEKEQVHETNLQIDGQTFRSQSFAVRNREGEYLYGMHLMEDVTAQVTYRTRIQDSERRFRDLTNSLDVSLILVDRNQQILMLNQAARDCYRLNDQDYLGQHCSEVFGHHGIVCDQNAVLTVFQDGQTISTKKQTASGRIFDLTFHPITDSAGEISTCTIVTRDVSEREKYIQKLKRYEQIVATSRDLVAFFDEDCYYLAVNPEYASYLGLSEAEIIGRHVSDVIGLDRYCDYLKHKDTVFTLKRSVLLNEWIDYPAAGRRYIELAVYPYHDGDKVVGFVVRGRDITEKNKQDARLRLSGKVLESITEGILVTDSKGIIHAVNPAFTDITGYSEAEALGSNANLLKSGRHDEAFYREIWSALHTSGHWRGEIWNRRKNGEIYPELLTINTITDDAGKRNYVAIFSDISSIKKASEKLEYLAHHNALTGLPNRRLLQARLEHSLQNAQRERTCGAVIFIDLDNFKKINDSLGHDAGDEVLKSVAQRLLANARQVDTVAHLSGDEFVAVLHKTKSIDDAITRANQIIESLQQPFVIENYELMVSGSLGIAEFDGTSDVTIDNLLKNADAAMYKAKESGKNRYHVYSPELTDAAVEKVLMESHLRKALERGELYLNFQPQIELHSGRVVAAEALLRWNNPELGMVSPDKFIPLSEETGQIISIGEWVLKSACEQMMVWRKKGLGLKRIAVNLSGKQIQLKDLHKQVERVLFETGLPSGSLELEITEGFVMQHPEQSIAVLHSIRNLGVELSIDDFGTGHSSLNYLKRLPINRLKIDQTFVSDIGTEMEGEAITRAVIAMGRSLNLQITAEGVETPEQHEYLEAHGCHEAQGYLFSRPLSAQKMLELLESDRILTRYAC